jgi:carboxymethylenebutenolidase
MGAHVVVPDGGSGPGIVLLMEIFGVGPYIRKAAERLASIGYTVLAPDLYWRIAPGATPAHTPEGLQEAFGLVQRLDVPAAVGDAIDALAHLRSMPETRGRAGVLGFCLGGTLAYLVAANGDPDVAVAYYGSGIHDALAQGDAITCPLLLHYGGRDDYIPIDKIDLVRNAFADRDEIELHVHDAGHAFDNSEAPMFYDASASDAAWKSTAEFLARTFPVA